MTDMITVVGSLLTFVNDTRREIADAKTVDQVKRVLISVTGLIAAARQASDKATEAEAAVLKLEAERRLGQLMQAQRETVGFSVGTKGSSIKGARVDAKPTPTEAGINKNLAHRARTAAAMPEATFKKAVEAKRKAVLQPKSRRRSKSTSSKITPEPETTPTDPQVVKLTAESLATDNLTTKPSGSPKSRRRELPFITEKIAGQIRYVLSGLADDIREDKYSAFGLDEIANRLVENADFIDDLIEIARRSNFRPLVDAIAAKLGGANVGHESTEREIEIKFLGALDEIKQLKARLAELDEARTAATEPSE